MTIVKGDPRIPFSIATTPRCRRSPFLRLLHFTLDTYLIMLSVKQGGIKYHFLGLSPYISIYIYIYMFKREPSGLPRLWSPTILVRFFSP